MVSVSEDRKPWERIEDEPGLWFNRFEQLRLLGPERSMLALYRSKWREKREKAGKGGTKEPKSIPGSWDKAAKKWNWKERWDAWDHYESERVAAEAEASRLEILSSGYAQRHERVKSLNKLANLLLGELETEDKRWLPDVKQIGGGEFAERVDIIRFNSPLIEQFRKTLDDLAAEMGERVKGIEIAGKDGGPISHTFNLANLSNDELIRLITNLQETAGDPGASPDREEPAPGED